MKIYSEDMNTGYLNDFYPIKVNFERVKFIEECFESVSGSLTKEQRSKFYDMFTIIRGIVYEKSAETRFDNIKPSSMKKMLIEIKLSPKESFELLSTDRFIIIPEKSPDIFSNCHRVETYSFDAMNKLNPRYNNYLELMFHNNLYTFSVYSYFMELVRSISSIFKVKNEWKDTQHQSKMSNNSDSLKNYLVDLYLEFSKLRSNMIQHLFSSAILTRNQENIDLVMKHMASEFYITGNEIEYSMDNNFAEMRDGKSVGLRHGDHSTIMLQEIKSYYSKG